LKENGGCPIIFCQALPHHALVFETSFGVWGFNSFLIVTIFIKLLLLILRDLDRCHSECNEESFLFLIDRFFTSLRITGEPNSI